MQNTMSENTTKYHKWIATITGKINKLTNLQTKNTGNGKMYTMKITKKKETTKNFELED